jgi:hypothetical protein
MDPIQPSTQQPIQPPVQIPDFQPKPNYLKTIILSVLIIITLSLIAYLAFQNQKLQKQVLNPPVSPTIQAPSPTPKTVSSSSLAPDETEGWKTYTNTEVGFSFKYPSEWKTQTGILNSGLISLETDRGDRFFAMYHQSYSISEWLEETQAGKITGKKTFGKYTYTVIEGGLMLKSLEYALDIKGNGFVRFVIEPDSNTLESEKTFNQILSTFQFLK